MRLLTDRQIMNRYLKKCSLDEFKDFVSEFENEVQLNELYNDMVNVGSSIPKIQYIQNMAITIFGVTLPLIEERPNRVTDRARMQKRTK